MSRNDTYPLDEAVRHALEASGAQLFDDPRRLRGYLLDYMRPDSDELRVIVRCCDQGFVHPYAEAVRDDHDAWARASKQAAAYLVHECLIDKDVARRVGMGVANGISLWKTGRAAFSIRETARGIRVGRHGTKVRPVAQPAPEPSDSTNLTKTADNTAAIKQQGGRRGRGRGRWLVAALLMAVFVGVGAWALATSDGNSSADDDPVESAEEKPDIWVETKSTETTTDADGNARVTRETTSEYDDSGNLLTRTSFLERQVTNADGSTQIANHYEGGVFDVTEYTGYDNSGYPTSKAYTDGTYGYVLRKTVSATLDDQGRAIELVIEGPENATSDNEGNWAPDYFGTANYSFVYEGDTLRRLEKTSRRDDGSTQDSETYVYDAEGHLLSLESKYSYHSGTSWFDTIYDDRLEYDAAGNCLRKTTRTTQSDSGGSSTNSTTVTTYEHDDAGHTTLETSTSDEGTTTVSYTDLLYDEDDKPLHQTVTTTKEDGSVSTDDVTYERDEDGNVARETHVRGDGTTVVTERTYRRIANPSYVAREGGLASIIGYF